MRHAPLLRFCGIGLSAARVLVLLLAFAIAFIVVFPHEHDRGNVSSDSACAWCAASEAPSQSSPLPVVVSIYTGDPVLQITRIEEAAAHPVLLVKSSRAPPAQHRIKSV